MSKIHVRALYDSLRASYWFLPLCMSILAVVLATSIFMLDQRIPNGALVEALLILQLEPGTVRSALTGIAGAAVGIIGVVFSITLVPLTIASSQFGPVLLRNYLRDVGTQAVLGTYCATVCYALWLLMLLPLNLTMDTVPQVAVTVGVAMLAIYLALLIYLFHHTAVSLQASNVVERLGAELLAVVDQEFPAGGSSGAKAPPATEEAARLALHGGGPIRASGTGYVRAVDIEALVGLAAASDLVLRVESPPGAFISRGEPLALGWPAERVEEDLEAEVNEAFLLGEYRTLVQDVEFGVMSLVVVASRALSPAINVPVTPLICLDRIGLALGLVAEREQPSAYHYGADGRLRLILQPQTFSALTEVAFDRIRQYGRTDAPLLTYLLHTIATVGARTTTEAQRHTLARHARLVEETADIACAADREHVRQGYLRALRALGLRLEAAVANGSRSDAEEARLVAGK